MKPYDPNAKCAKCGHDSITTRFIGAFAPRRDTIHRCCNRCGYGWNESPLDSSDDSHERSQIDALNAAAHAGHPAFPKHRPGGFNPRD